MGLNYSWSIIGLKKANTLNGLNDVITEVDYRYTATDENGNTAFLTSSTKIDEPSADSFVDINNVTEAQVIEWVKNGIATYYMNQDLKRQIENSIDPKNITVESLPWI